MTSCPVVLSVTSLPSRIGKIRPCLESLLSGTRRPDKIIVSLPFHSAREKTEYQVPDFLNDRHFCADVVELVRVENDWGPGTKLLGGLPLVSENSCMVLVDDDVIYSPNFLQHIADAQLNERQASFSYFTYTVGGIVIGQGCDGFSFWRPNLTGISEFFQKYVSGTDLVLHDDFWISIFLASKHVRVKTLNHLVRINDAIYLKSYDDESSLRYLTGSQSRDILQKEHLGRLLKEVEMSSFLRMKLRFGVQAEFLFADPSRKICKKISNFLSGR